MTETVVFKDLLDKSSMGAPDVKAAVADVSDYIGQRILDRADELKQDARGLPFLLQKRGAACTLVALCNALRWYGKPSPEIYTEEFNKLRTLGGGRWGPITKPFDCARAMGLDMVALADKDPFVFPCILTCPDPEENGLHSVLALSGGSRVGKLVNYKWITGPVLQTVPWVVLNRESMHKVHRFAWAVSPVATHG